MSRKAALLIGCDRYDDPGFEPLTSPSIDVEHLAEVLRSPSIGAFDEVTPLIDEPNNIVRLAIAEFFHDRTPDDLLMIYFSGHGYLSEGRRLVLATRDTKQSVARATGVDAAFVSDEMDRCRSRRQVLILDCCHSGAFVGGKGADDIDAQLEEALRGNGYGRYVLAASDVTEQAWAAPGHRPNGRSAFTHHIIEGLATWEADDDHDGAITVDDLYRYAESAMLEVPDADRPQTPRKWLYEQKQGDLVIASRPGVQVLPRDIRANLAHPWEEIRISAVARLLELVGDGEGELVSAARTEFERMCENDPHPSVREAAAEALSGDTDALQQRVAHRSGVAHEDRPPALKVAVDGPVIAPAGTAVPTSVTVHNEGATPVEYLTVLHNKTLLDAPFDLGSGEKRALPLTVTAGGVGDRHHEVWVTGVGNDGRVERAVARFTVTATPADEALAPTAGEAALPTATTREKLRRLARRHDPDDQLPCPVCQVPVKARNLVRHVDRKHMARPVRRQTDPEDEVHARVEPGPRREPMLSQLYRLRRAGSMPADPRRDTTTAPPAGDRPAQGRPSSLDWSRQRFKTLARASPPDAYLVCPVCDVQVKAKRLVQHYDREHAR